MYFYDGGANALIVGQERDGLGRALEQRVANLQSSVALCTMISSHQTVKIHPYTLFVSMPWASCKQWSLYDEKDRVPVKVQDIIEHFDHWYGLIVIEAANPDGAVVHARNSLVLYSPDMQPLDLSRATLSHPKGTVQQAMRTIHAFRA